MDDKRLDGRNENAYKESTWGETVVRGRINFNRRLNRSGTSQGSANVMEHKARHDLVSTPQLRMIANCCDRQELDALSSIGAVL